jgi:hypothetical protein
MPLRLDGESREQVEQIQINASAPVLNSAHDSTKAHSFRKLKV